MKIAVVYISSVELVAKIVTNCVEENHIPHSHRATYNTTSDLVNNPDDRDGIDGIREGIRQNIVALPQNKDVVVDNHNHNLFRKHTEHTQQYVWSYCKNQISSWLVFVLW